MAINSFPIETTTVDISSLIKSSGVVTPEQYGATSDGTSDTLAIQAAIDHVAANPDAGFVWLSNPYALDAPIVLKKGVHLMGNASFDRRSFPNTFNGCRLYPTPSYSGTLLEIGNSGEGLTNPQAATITGVSFDGRDEDQNHVLNSIGVYIRDTSDVRFFNCYFGGFDRTDNTGFGVIVEGTAEGNCFGTTFAQCIFSNSQHGVFYTGLGTTDMRHSNNLYVGVTRALTLGYDDRTTTIVQQGGAGTQIVNDHFTYTGMPTAGWFIRTGGQAGSLMCSNTYFDQHGTAFPIRLGNAKAQITGARFLCAASQTSEGLIRVQTSGSQETMVSGCMVDGNNSLLEGLVYYSAITGSTVPTGGVITGNVAYNCPSWVAFAQNNSSVIPETSGPSFWNSVNSYQA